MGKTTFWLSILRRWAYPPWLDPRDNCAQGYQAFHPSASGLFTVAALWLVCLKPELK